MAYSAVAVLVTAEPFANSVLGAGMMVGISPYLLVQWLVPVATESPELVIAFVLIQHRRAAQGVAVLLSSAVSQWTLALGTLPLAYMAGVGKGPLPLLGREQVEILLTMGQALLAIAVLVTLRLRRRDATLMLGLFVAQLCDAQHGAARRPHARLHRARGGHTRLGALGRPDAVAHLPGGARPRRRRGSTPAMAWRVACAVCFGCAPRSGDLRLGGEMVRAGSVSAVPFSGHAAGRHAALLGRTRSRNHRT